MSAESVSKSPTVPLAPVGVKSAILSKSPTKKTYYSRLDGARYCFADGGVATFTGGQFEFDPAVVDADYFPPEGKGTAEECWVKRHKELEYVCTIPNPVFSAVPVEVQRSDSKVLREVGHAGGGSVGIVGSFAAQSMLKQSNG
jgi:hypothetical protein